LKHEIHKSLTLLLAVVSISLCPLAEAQPNEPIPVAVLNFTNQAQGQSDWDWLQKGLADLLISDLSQHPQLQLVSREQMQLAILRMEHDGGLLPEWQEETARQLKAARAVFGTYRINGGMATIQVTILDMLKGKSIGTVVAVHFPDGMSGKWHLFDVP